MKKYLATGVVLATKATKIVKSIKVLTFIKPFISLFSMSLFAAVYSWRMGVLMSVTFTGLLLIHELGHVFAMKRKGYDTKWPVFIPFVGAALFMKELPKSRHVEAYIGYGGPLVGTAAAIICTVLAIALKSPFWHAAALLGMGVNLFNMFPMSPLDGGRITQAVHRHFKLFGAAALLVLTLWLKNPSFLVLWIVVLSDFDHIPYGVRFWFAVVLCAALYFFRFVHIQGLEPVHTSDLVMGAVFLFFMACGMYFRDKNRDYRRWEDRRTKLGWKKRTMWLVLWLVLLGVQIGGMVLLHDYHPH